MKPNVGLIVKAVIMAAFLGLAGNAFGQGCPTGPAVATGPFTNLPTGSTATFSWTAASNTPTGYDVLVSYNGSASSTVACSAGPTATTCTSPVLPDGHYDFVIRAHYSGCVPGLDSVKRDFTVGCPNTPVLQSPADNATNVSTTPTLNWTDVGADSYDIYLGPVGSGCSGQPGATSFTSSFHPPTLAGSTTYEWKIVAKKTNCGQTISACGKFTTAASCTAPGAFDLSSPANNGTVTTTSPQLSWQGSTGAINYRLHLGITNPPVPQASDPTVTGTNYTPPGLNAGTYYWYVDAVNACTTSPKTASSSVFSFTVRPNCSSTAPTLSAPPNNTTVDDTKPVTFVWSSVSGASGYEVLVSGDGGANFNRVASTTGETSVTATATLTDGNYIWFVRASFGAGCTPNASAISRFTVAAPKNCSGNAAPTLVIPANNATNLASPVTFNWNGVANATGYNVYLAASNATAGNPTLLGSTTATKLVASVPGGTWQWYVEATFDGCPSLQSGRFTFTTATSTGCSTTPATLTAPADGSSMPVPPDGVTFKWNAVTNAAAYKLYVSFNGSTPVVVSFNRDTSHTISLPAGSVEWYVETLFDGCPSTVSSHFKLTLTSTCPANPQPPQITAPADGATNIASPVSFAWSVVPGATRYRVFASLNGGAPLEIYENTTPQFTSPVPAGTITWFVEALFDGGCPSVVSNKATFTVTSGSSCSTAPVTLLTPANNATITGAGAVTFTWLPGVNPVATAYSLFISVNGTSFDLAGTTEAPHFTANVPEGTIQWYVVSTTVGCPEVKSATNTFTVSSATNCPSGTINLTAPAQGATVTSPVTLQWSGVNGITSYRVYASVDGGPATVVARVSTTTAPVSLPSGSVEWAVEGVGAATCPSILSGHGKFTVTKGANCDAHKPVTLVAPSDGATVPSPVTLSWNATTGAIAYRVWLAENDEPFEDLGLTNKTTATADVDNGKVRWFVEALFDGCPSLPSSVATFTATGKPDQCSGDAPVTISPADGATNVPSPTTFVWSEIADAIEYRVHASLNGSEFAVIARTKEATLTLAIPPGNYVWFVEAAFKECASTRSPKAKFTVPAAQNCGTTAPQLVAPPNGATNVVSPVDLDWNPVTGAIGYVVFARFNEGSPTPIGETLDTTLQRSLPAGNFEWWVVAFFAGCPPLESKHFTFTIPTTAQCNHKNPILLSPPDGADDLTSPILLAWTPVPEAKSYKVFASVNLQPPSVIATSTVPATKVTIASGNVLWFVQAVFDNCPPTVSALGHFTVLGTPPPCGTPDRPEATVVGQVASGTTYTVRWKSVANANVYELQEATSLDFSTASTQEVNGVSATFSHTATATPVQYFYRVRAVSSCSDVRGPYSFVVGVVVIPPKPPGGNHTTAEIGSQGNVIETIFIPGSANPVQFSAHGDKPWMTITPSSGTIPPQGITLTVTADPSVLLLGTNTGTVILTYSSSGKTGSDDSSGTSVPVSVSLVTPVVPGGKTAPTPDSLIIPAVAHAAGANNSLFQSDVRITNLAAQTLKYVLTFTPSNVDGTQNGKQTTIEVAPGSTTAIDDILSSFFGLGTDGTGAAGVLQIQPLSSGSSGFTGSTSVPTVQTVASSRTYNYTPNGTFGQYIPAIPFSQFISKAADASTKQLLSLQQIAQSAAYRTNFGLVEAAGEPATVLATVYDNHNVKLAEIPISMLAGEHLQLNAFLAANNISVTDGRIEVEVTSATGKVTAYASVVDNLTNDPLLVSPVLKGAVTASRYTIPGVADINNGLASWRTDMRLFNSGSSAVTATLTYYPQGAPGSPVTSQVSIDPGEVKVINNTLQSLYNVTNSGGSLIITTPAASNVIATARTYNQTSNGTYGQFIPAVTVADSVGMGDRSLQLLQLEQSNRFRTNVGIAETSGAPATAEISVILPDSLAAPKVQIPLAANEFVQIPLAAFGLSNAYNARATVKVISGSGKVTAYGSVIDQLTQDPTYVPAQ